MKRPRPLLAAAAAAGTLTAGAVGYQACEAAETPRCPEPVVVPVPTGPQWPSSDPGWDTPVTIDATGVWFLGGGSTTVAPVKLRPEWTPDGTCMVGGFVTSGAPEGTTWDDYHHSYGVTLSQDQATLRGTRIGNVGDAVAVSGEDWLLEGLHVTEAYDDCVQADRMTGGRIKGGLFNGCHVFFSASNGVTERTGHENRVEITDTLVWVRSQHESYRPDKYGYGQHGPIFKVSDGRHPRLVLESVMIRVDNPAAYGENVAGQLGLPAGSECVDVVLIGTEAWPADELATWVDQCQGLVLGDTSDWDAAVAAWEP